ncbi:hypothetical protein EII18_06010 [Comamonadaceae bacterium OH3737_COT-264]|nr:hypothetical protein EII18_06010 [Comamonadaceae bacterium OH3737_COT-264]
MSERMDFQKVQPHADEVQALYKEWVNLAPKLEAAKQYWQHATDVMQQLAESHFDGDYGQCLDALEQGLTQETDPFKSFKAEAQGYNAINDASLWNTFAAHEQDSQQHRVWA